MNTSREFLKEGALIQTSSDEFRLFIGPFKPCSPEDLGETSLFYTTNFWHFLNHEAARTEYFLPKQTLTLTRSALLDFLPADKKSKISQIHWNLPDSEEFRQQYDWIQEQIDQGSLEKALPIAVQRGEGDIGSRLVAVLSQIVGRLSRNFAYGYWNEQTGIVGYTPEVLSHWSKDEGTLNTMALAGTWKKNSASIDFDDAKIKQEHEFVIQDIQRQLKGYALIEKSPTQVVELPHLFHLRTNFTYRCESAVAYLKALHLLHPTAALGIYPRDQRIVQDFSQISIQKQRKQFGAPVGFINKNEAFMLVGIRNVIWDQKQIELFAGCGVTKDSVYHDEWNEILAKQDSVKRMLGLEN